MADIAAIRAGVCTTLASITDLERYDTSPDSPVTPCVIVLPSEQPILFDETMGRGLDAFELMLIVLVSRTISAGAQAKLDSYMAGSGSASIKAKLDADRTLNGTAQSSRLVGVSEYGTFEWGDVSYFGCKFMLNAWASGAS